MLITKEIISFAFVGEEREVDYVPLCEVEFIMEMKDIIVDTGPHGIPDPDTTPDSGAVQIATVKDGHNSGRPYYIKPRDREALEELTRLLKKNSKAARKRAQAANSFRRAQYAVRKVYDSQPFQIFVALLISAVGSPSSPPSAQKLCAALTWLSLLLLLYYDDVRGGGTHRRRTT
jgi:hypothetical protein